MSYNPSQAIGSKSVQIDINGASSVTSDITSHSITSFTARNKFFVESKYYIPVNSSVSGLLNWYNWIGFEPFGGLVKGNLVSGTITSLDDAFIGSNTQNTALSMQATSQGGAVVQAGRKMFTYMWRVQ